LFVKLKHIGDSLLLTPTLTAARAAYPDASIWVVVRRGCEGILAGCPAIDRVLTAAAPEAESRSAWNWLEDWRLLRQLRRQRFDYAFELSDGDRGRWLVCLSGTRFRCANAITHSFHWWWRPWFNWLSTFNWLDRHRVEKDFFTVSGRLALGDRVPPLTFVCERAEVPGLGQQPGQFAVFHPGTRWQRKRWPVEKWVQLGRFLLERLPQIVISVGSDEKEVALAAELQSALGAAALSTQGRLSWAQLAGLLYQARLFVGVDTAAMHLAGACQCPTVAIFGSSKAIEWRPWQVPHRLVRPPEETRRALPEEHQIQAVDVAAVARACLDMLAGAASHRITGPG
jgi:heptosyltransferase-3